MTTLEIILLFCFGVCSILIVAQGRIMDSQSKLLDDAINRINEYSNETSVLYDYCLKHVHNEALEKEDYETCAKCVELLKKLEK